MFLQAFENSLVHLRKRNMWSQLTDQNVQSLNKMSQVRETGGGGVGEHHSTYCPVWRYIMSHNTQISPKRIRFQGCESSTVHSFIINRLKPDVWYRASDRPLNGLLNASEAYLLDQLFSNSLPLRACLACCVVIPVKITEATVEIPNFNK